MPKIPPAVCSLSRFKRETTPIPIVDRGRGSKLQEIDAALGKWESGLYPRNEPRYALALILDACRAWLRKKDSEGHDSRKAAVRRLKIQALSKQVFHRMQYETFESRKRSGRFNGPLRSLTGAYKKERTTYLGSGKSYAISGSTGDLIQDFSKSPGMRRGWSDQIGQELAPNIDLEAMTDQEFETLVRTFGGPERSEVYFMKKETRIKYLIVIEEGLMYDGPDQLLETTDHPGFAYAMDEYGDLFACDIGKIEREQGRTDRLNHSTFNAGKDVICAGIILVREGRLVRIDNNSGHYKPTRAHLVNALGVLNRMGVNLNRVVARSSEMGFGSRGQLQISIFNDAAQLLANPHMRPNSVL
jgi:hypothetical protein